MPDFTHAIEQTLVFFQNLLVCKDQEVQPDFSDDYLIFDHTVEATYTSVGSQTLGRDGRVQDAQVRTAQLCRVGRYVLNFRDLLSEASGHLRVGDVRLEISQKELDGIVPKPGDKVVLPEGTYHAFAVDWDPITKMYIVWCRK